MLSAQGLLAGKDLYRATPAVTQDLGFSVLPNLVAYYKTEGDAEDLFKTITDLLLVCKLHIDCTNPYMYS
jgi:hypothetical protein